MTAERDILQHRFGGTPHAAATQNPAPFRRTQIRPPRGFAPPCAGPAHSVRAARQCPKRRQRQAGRRVRTGPAQADDAAGVRADAAPQAAAEREVPRPARGLCRGSGGSGGADTEALRAEGHDGPAGDRPDRSDGNRERGGRHGGGSVRSPGRRQSGRRGPDGRGGNAPPRRDGGSDAQNGRAEVRAHARHRRRDGVRKPAQGLQGHRVRLPSGVRLHQGRPVQRRLHHGQHGGHGGQVQQVPLFGLSPVQLPGEHTDRVEGQWRGLSDPGQQPHAGPLLRRVEEHRHLGGEGRV